MNELTGHEPNIDKVKDQGEALIEADHFASDHIQQQIYDLQSRWRELKLLAGQRTQRLKDSLEAQRVGKMTMAFMAVILLIVYHTFFSFFKRLVKQMCG